MTKSVIMNIIPLVRREINNQGVTRPKKWLSIMNISNIYPLFHRFGARGALAFESHFTLCRLRRTEKEVAVGKEHGDSSHLNSRKSHDQIKRGFVQEQVKQRGQQRKWPNAAFAITGIQAQ